MPFRKLADAQEAWDSTTRENTAYHHALVASMHGQLKPAGSVVDGDDVYTWQVAFRPRYCGAIIVETFRSHINRDDTVRVFWLSDWACPDSHWSDWQTLAAEARNIEIDRQ